MNRNMARLSPALKTSVSARALIALALSCCAAYAQQTELVPLPSRLYGGDADNSNPVLDLRDRALGVGNDLEMTAQIPDSLTVENHGGSILYDSEKRTVTYDGEGQPVRLKTDTDSYMLAQSISANLSDGLATLEGPLTIYSNDVMVRCKGNATYDLNCKVARMEGIRAKVGGLIIRGSSIEYHTDAAEKPYIVIKDAYVSTEDVATPSAWIGTGNLTIYPGESGSVSRLSVALAGKEMAVPVLGWVKFSHSLNPREGYMPGIGGKSAWGSYLLNSYGVLLGNRRTEHGIPTADYLVTSHMDFRSRRGMALGLDAEDIALARRYEELQGLQTYLPLDSDPMINPVEGQRYPTRHNRYRVALQWEHDVTPAEDTRAKWNLAANINAVSDRYVLRDFFEDHARTNGNPDNTVRITRTGRDSETMLYTRFTPNNYYASDERAELSYYRVRKPIAGSPISYETHSSATIMRQYLPTEDRIIYRSLLNYLSDGDLKDYFMRMLNTQSYARVNTTHELSTAIKPLPFLNVTPKTGFGYTGYYDVGGIGSDNRFLGYLGCDVDMKFHRRYANFAYKRFGLRGLTHVIHPYISFSQATISSSNQLVPQVDYWSGGIGATTITPMPLDFIGFTGLDGWGQWTVVRFGVHNLLNSSVDEERIRLLDWNVFFDYKADSPTEEGKYSNLYSYLRLAPSERLRFTMESQTPAFHDSADYSQYSFSASYMPFHWLEGTFGYRSIQDHPLFEDAEQLYVHENLRFDERHTFSGRWYFDMDSHRVPIQEYSLYRHCGAWYLGFTFFLRDNGGKKEEGFGVSFTLGETGTAIPFKFM